MVWRQDSGGAGGRFRFLPLVLAACMLAGAGQPVRAVEIGEGGGYAFELDRGGTRAATRSVDRWQSPPKAMPKPRSQARPVQVVAGSVAGSPKADGGPVPGKTRTETGAAKPVVGRELVAPRAIGKRRQPRRAVPAAVKSDLPATWDGHRRMGNAFYVERDGILLWADTKDPVSWWTLMEPPR